MLFRSLQMLSLIEEHMSIAELETLTDKLSERYASEGLALPTDGAHLVNDLLTLHVEQLERRYAI